MKRAFNFWTVLEHPFFCNHTLSNPHTCHAHTRLNVATTIPMNISSHLLRHFHVTIVHIPVQHYWRIIIKLIRPLLISIWSPNLVQIDTHCWTGMRTQNSQAASPRFLQDSEMSNYTLRPVFASTNRLQKHFPRIWHRPILATHSVNLPNLITFKYQGLWFTRRMNNSGIIRAQQLLPYLGFHSLLAKEGSPALAEVIKLRQSDRHTLYQSSDRYSVSVQLSHGHRPPFQIPPVQIIINRLIGVPHPTALIHTHNLLL